MKMKIPLFVLCAFIFSFSDVEAAANQDQATPQEHNVKIPTARARKVALDIARRLIPNRGSAGLVVPAVNRPSAAPPIQKTGTKARKTHPVPEPNPSGKAGKGESIWTILGSAVLVAALLTGGGVLGAFAGAALAGSTGAGIGFLAGAGGVVALGFALSRQPAPPKESKPPVAAASTARSAKP